MTLLCCLEDDPGGDRQHKIQHRGCLCSGCVVVSDLTYIHIANIQNPNSIPSIAFDTVCAFHCIVFLNYSKSNDTRSANASISSPDSAAVCQLAFALLRSDWSRGANESGEIAEALPLL